MRKGPLYLHTFVINETRTKKAQIVCRCVTDTWYGAHGKA